MVMQLLELRTFWKQYFENYSHFSLFGCPGIPRICAGGSRAVYCAGIAAKPNTPTRLPENFTAADLRRRHDVRERH